VDRFRVVIHNQRFERELRRAEPDPRRADEVAAALEFALARHPELGFPIPPEPLHIWPIYIRDAEYVAYYRFDETEVELISLRASGEEWP
jgi:hypothetical protein